MDSDASDSRITAYSCRQCQSVTFAERGKQCCGEEMIPLEGEATADPELMTLLRNVFGISRTGIDICVYITKTEQATTDEIATALDINRSNVTRQLSSLRSLGVVERRDETLKKGGRIHVYTPVPPEETRQRLREGFFSWASDALTLLDEVDRRKLEAASESRLDTDSSLTAQGDE